MLVFTGDRTRRASTRECVGPEAGVQCPELTLGVGAGGRGAKAERTASKRAALTTAQHGCGERT